MIKYLPKNERECPICHHDLEIEDVNYRFYGNQDELYVCSCCSYALEVKVRFGRIWKKESVIIHRKNESEDD